MLREDRKIRDLFASQRKVTDGRGSVALYTGHACSHYEEMPLDDADEAVRAVLRYVAGVQHDPEHPPMPPDDSPALREATRTFVGYGRGPDDEVWVAVCHDSQCYPAGWSNQQIAACEVFVHEVVTKPEGGFTCTTIPGPRAHCEKVCYKTTPHFYDIEVWDQEEDRPAWQGRFSKWEYPSSSAGRKYRIVLRCENCHHGYDLVTKNSSPSRWRRLMKSEAAREILQGAKADQEPWGYEDHGQAGA